MFIKSRLDEEKVTVSRMIELYCMKKHGKGLCPDCRQMQEYVMQRLDNCKYGNEKPVCAKCPVHCYKPNRREEIRKVMQFAGPQMVLYHPLLALLHTYRSMTSRKY